MNKFVLSLCKHYNKEIAKLIQNYKDKNRVDISDFSKEIISLFFKNLDDIKENNIDENTYYEAKQYEVKNLIKKDFIINLDLLVLQRIERSEYKHTITLNNKNEKYTINFFIYTKKLKSKIVFNTFKSFYYFENNQRYPTATIKVGNETKYTHYYLLIKTNKIGLFIDYKEKINGELVFSKLDHNYHSLLDRSQKSYLRDMHSDLKNHGKINKSAFEDYSTMLLLLKDKNIQIPTTDLFTHRYSKIIKIFYNN